MAIIASWNINSVRIRVDILKKFIEEINPDELKLYLNKKTDYFVKLAEDIIESNYDIISRLITLEALRYFTKRIDKKYLPFLAYKLQFLLENK